MSDDARMVAPAAGRNRDPILAALRRVLPGGALVLEVGSGTGEHVAHFAAALPGVTFQPSDPDPARRASVDAWATGLPNVRPAVALDAAAAAWPLTRADAVLCINMIHVAPPAATSGLLLGAARLLPPGGALLLYGPFRRAGEALAPGNAEFDASLRDHDPFWGLRVLEDVAAEAGQAGFGVLDIQPMPANNLFVAFRRLFTPPPPAI